MLIEIPGLVDMHVHFREPGFGYKEDIASGAAAAAAGGVTTCCCMPNTSPVADNAKTVEYIREKGGLTPINVLPIGAVTAGQRGETLTDFEALKAAGAVAVSDDGMPVVSDDIMREALIKADKTGLLLISHCEPETEMAERDVRLAGELGVRVHIAHVSRAETVEVIRRAKAEGVAVTAETCPHYFSLNSDEVARQGSNACMNPPLGTERDIQAVIDGLRDGTIDVIATDHAPHSPEEKALPVGKAPNGIIGLETSLAVTLTYLYHTGILSIDEIVRLMSTNPARILGIEGQSPTKVGQSDSKEGQSPKRSPKRRFPSLFKVGQSDCTSGTVPLHIQQSDFITVDTDEEWVVDPSQFKSKARNTPFAGMTLKGKVK